MVVGIVATVAVIAGGIALVLAQRPSGGLVAEPAAPVVSASATAALPSLNPASPSATSTQVRSLTPLATGSASPASGATSATAGAGTPGAATTPTASASVTGTRPASATAGTPAPLAPGGAPAATAPTGAVTRPAPTPIQAADATTACALALVLPVVSPTTTVQRPAGEPAEVFNVGNDRAVFNGGTPPRVSITRETWATELLTYHWNSGQGQEAGTVALLDAAGYPYGPWQTELLSGVYWVTNPNLWLPAGEYTVCDSDPATFAQNALTNGQGMAWMKGVTRP